MNYPALLQRLGFRADSTPFRLGVRLMNPLFAACHLAMACLRALLVSECKLVAMRASITGQGVMAVLPRTEATLRVPSRHNSGIVAIGHSGGSSWDI